MDKENGTARVSIGFIVCPHWLNYRARVQIQILLHLLILSLPGLPPPPPPEFPEMSSVKRRKRPRKKVTPVITPADRLEAFMDKLSMWQLMGDLDDSNERERVTVTPEDDLDWTQRFCQSIVEPLSVSPSWPRRMPSNEY